MLTKDVRLVDVLARWAYSEIIGSNSEHSYDTGRDIVSLRAKRRSGIPLEDLSPDERYNLAFLCGCGRPNLILFTIGADLFDMIPLDRDAVAALFVPPNVWHPESNGQVVPFEHYITTHSARPNDARYISPTEKPYSSSADPLTICRLYEKPLLLDGYHRAARFWRTNPPSGRIAAYVPRALLAIFE
jgi:hypothetical protein